MYNVTTYKNMTYGRRTLTFKDDEADLAEWLNQPGNAQRMKDAAAAIMQGIPFEKQAEQRQNSDKARAAFIEAILWNTIGQDVEEGYYPNKWNISGEEMFIKIGLEKKDLNKILKYRISTLQDRHPAEAEEVIAAWIRKYPKTAAAAGLIK